MTPIKLYMAQQLIGKTMHFKCSCILALDVVGTIKDIRTSGEEILFMVDVGGKIITIGSNHPSLEVEEV